MGRSQQNRILGVRQRDYPALKRCGCIDFTSYVFSCAKPKNGRCQLPADPLNAQQLLFRSLKDILRSSKPVHQGFKEVVADARNILQGHPWKKLFHKSIADNPIKSRIDFLWVRHYQTATALLRAVDMLCFYIPVQELLYRILYPAAGAVFGAASISLKNSRIGLAT